MKDILAIGQRIQETLAPAYIEQYRLIAKFLVTKSNLFILGKGVGLYAANYIASKFL